MSTAGKHFTAIVFGAALAALCGTAQASAPVDPATPSAAIGKVDAPAFADLDKNGDARLKRSEIPRDMTELRTRFADYDADHNGALSKGEYIGYLASSQTYNYYPGGYDVPDRPTTQSNFSDRTPPGRGQ